MKMRNLKIYLSLLLPLLLFPFFQNFSTSPKIGFVEGELLIAPLSKESELDVERLYKSHGAKLKRKVMNGNVHQISVPPQAAEALEKALQRSGKVKYVEKNILGQLSFVPNDPHYGRQWHHTLMNSDKAWDMTTGSNNIIIAILDSGFDPNLADISSKLLPGYNSNANNSNIQANNGICSNSGHGTVVASTAAGLGNDGFGTAGIAWNNSILPVLIFAPDCSLQLVDAVEGIVWAVDNGARVINMSWIFYWAPAPQSLIDATNYALNKGVVMVAAAGNDNQQFASDSNGNIFQSYPQTVKGVITVAATDSLDMRTTFSNFGPQISVSAPGKDVITSGAGGGINSCYGTSFSSPLVAGTAALMLSANPSLPQFQIKSLLESSAKDLGAAGWDQYYGSGRVDVQRAVAAASTATPIANPINGQCGTSNGGTFSTAPTANLCAAGTATEVILSGSKFNWNCNGISGGNTANCSANYFVPDTIAPSAPSNLTSSIQTRTQKRGKRITTTYTVSLTWLASQDNVGVSSYQIYKNGTLIGTVSSSVLTFSDSNVVKGTQYTYTVYALDAAKNKSAASNLVNVVP